MNVLEGTTAAVPDDVLVFLVSFLKQVQDALGTDMVGMYLYGSLALGDFDAASSDLDVLVATARGVAAGQLDRFKRLHAAIEQGGSVWARRLEVAYLPVDALRRHDPSGDTLHPFLSPVCPFGMIKLGEDWILNRHVLFDKGVVLAGPPPSTLIDPISPEDIRNTARNLLRHWRAHLSGPDWMKPRKYQAFTILTMCRALYAVQCGGILSKTRAAEWGMKNLPGEWSPLIRKAMFWRDDPNVADLKETLQFLRFATDSIN